MKKLLSPAVVGVLVGAIVTAAFIWCYTSVTTYVGKDKPVRATQEELSEKYLEYYNETMPHAGTASVPVIPEPGGPCCFLYGFYSENGQEYQYVGLVAKQVFMEEYLIRADLSRLAWGPDVSTDHVWKGSGEITADGYIFLKYTAHYEIDENGASVTYERHVKLLDLVSVVFLFSLADVAGRGFWRMHLKKKAEESSAK